MVDAPGATDDEVASSAKGPLKPGLEILHTLEQTRALCGSQLNGKAGGEAHEIGVGHVDP